MYYNYLALPKNELHKNCDCNNIAEFGKAETLKLSCDQQKSYVESGKYNDSLI